MSVLAKASFDCLMVLPVIPGVLNCLLLPVVLLQGREGTHPWSRQQQPAKVTPIDQGGRSEGDARSQAWDPAPAAAAPSMNQSMHQEQPGVRLSGPGMVSTASKAEHTSLPAVGDYSGMTQPGVSAAAAAAAASAQLSQTQARVAVLEEDKVQLSTQLSAAHSCVQQLRDAEALSKEVAIMPDKTAEEDGQRRQLAHEVTKVGYRAFTDSVVKCRWLHLHSALKAAKLRLCRLGLIAQIQPRAPQL